MRLREPVVNLHGVAKFERGFLILLLLQVGFAALDVFGFGFFGVGAGERRKREGSDKAGEQNRRQTPAIAGARALFVIHAVFRTPSRLLPGSLTGATVVKSSSRVWC